MLVSSISCALDACQKTSNGIDTDSFAEHQLDCGGYVKVRIVDDLCLHNKGQTMTRVLLRTAQTREHVARMGFPSADNEFAR